MPKSALPKGEIRASILTFWPPRAGVRASILYGVPYDLVAAVLWEFVEVVARDWLDTAAAHI